MENKMKEYRLEKYLMTYEEKYGKYKDKPKKKVLVKPDVKKEVIKKVKKVKKVKKGIVVSTPDDRFNNWRLKNPFEYNIYLKQTKRKVLR